MNICISFIQFSKQKQNKQINSQMRKNSKNSLKYLHYRNRKISQIKVGVDQDKLLVDYLDGPTMEHEVNRKKQWFRYCGKNQLKSEVEKAQKNLIDYVRNKRNTYNPNYHNKKMQKNIIQYRNDFLLAEKKQNEVFNECLLEELVDKQCKAAYQQQRRAKQIKKQRNNELIINKLKFMVDRPFTKGCQNKNQEYGLISLQNSSVKPLKFNSKFCKASITRQQNPLLIESSPSQFYAGKRCIKTARCRY